MEIVNLLLRLEITEPLEEDELNSLKCFLGKVIQTKDYKSKDARPLLFEGIQNILTTLFKTKNKDLRTHILHLMASYSTTCGDAISHGLQDIHIGIQIFEANQSGSFEERKLKLEDLGKSIYRLQTIGEAAKRLLDTTTDQHTEDLEVYMYFEITAAPILRDLNLPIPVRAQSMLYSDYATVRLGCTKEAVNTAVKNVEDLTAEQYTTFLSTWPPYQSILREEESNNLDTSRLTSYTGSNLIELKTKTCAITCEPLDEAGLDRRLVANHNNDVIFLSTFKKSWIGHGRDPLTNAEVPIETLENYLNQKYNIINPPV